MCKISIIIPVFNAESTIERCINSIINQTYKDYEIIAVNDGSKDNSLKLLKKYKKLLKEKLIIINQKNQGVALARNNGIRTAKGKYLAFIDNDDYIDNNYLEKYINEINNNDFDIIIGGYRRPTADNKIIESRYPKDNIWSKYSIVAPWAKLYKRDFIVKNHIEFLNYGIGEDVYFYIQVLDKTSNIKIINYIGYNWFYNVKSVSNTLHKGFNKNIDILFLIEKTKEKVNGEGIILKGIVDYFYIRLIIYYLLWSGRTSSSNEFLLEYRRLSKYLQNNFPGYQDILLYHTPNGETLKVKFIMKLFVIFEKLHLMKLFSKIYCIRNYDG
jgi:glycosyltransferase involved in cell wall biosynthesis